MDTRRLGGSDLDVSVLGLGCNQIGRVVDAAGAAALLDACEEAGVTLLDTSDIYGARGVASEALLGEALAGRRDRFIVATKFGMEISGMDGVPDLPRGSREYIRWAVEGSLRRLRTDVIDLYQYHEPDGITPVAETLAALGELVAEGKVRFIGSSNVSAAQVDEAAAVAAGRGLTAFVSVQNKYSLIDRAIEAEVIPACERHGLGVIPFFPLEMGLLTGKYRRGEPAPAGARLAARDEIADDATFGVLEALERYAAERSLTMLDVAIGGLAARPQVTTVIAGATRPEQIAANARAAGWQPGAADLAALDAITAPAS